MTDWSGLPLPENAPARGTCVRITRPELGLVELVLDPPHREHVVLDVPLWRDIALAVESVDPEAGDRGLVLRGRDPLHFAFGADIDAIEAVQDSEIVRRLTLAVHDVLGRLERLARRGRVTTVAALGGPVPGGALELALGCRVVLAADHPKTRVGLPETKLGIIPGWGGTHRLTKKIGIPAALQAILSGRLYDARRANRLGIVDRITPPEYLERVARDLAMGRERAPARSRPVARWLVDRNPLAAWFIERSARKRTLAKSHGHYPAPEVAIELVVRAPRTGRKDAAAKEADAVARLATGPVCKHLLAVFRSSEAAKKLSQDGSGRTPPAFERGAVVGAGVMGAAIASLMAERGIATRISDLEPEALDRALIAHRTEIARKRKRRRLRPHEAMAALDRLDGVRGLIGLSRTELVVEAVAETLEVKREVLAQVAAAVPDDALIATNTSSLSVSAIAQAVDHPERVVGLHFFNPVRKMPLVEVVPGERTSQESLRRAAALALRLGKTPVVVKDVAGFLVNRLLGPYLDEALRLFELGVHAARLEQLLGDFGMPMGPLRLLDEVGFDIAQHTATSLYGAYGDRMRPSEVLAPCIAEKRLGKKSGRGFYDWSKPERPELAEDLFRLRRSGTLVDLPDEQVVDRCVLSMVNEAARALQEGVVATPAELDLATIFGTGFAPFRGGLLRHADSLGAGSILERLAAIAECPDVAKRTGGPEKFAPAPLLERLAEEGRGFHGSPPLAAPEPDAEETRSAG